MTSDRAIWMILIDRVQIRSESIASPEGWRAAVRVEQVGVDPAEEPVSAGVGPFDLVGP